MDDKSYVGCKQNYSAESESLLHYKNKKKMINLIMSILFVAFLFLTVYAMVNYDTFYEYEIVNWVFTILVNNSYPIESAILLTSVGVAVISGVLSLICLCVWFILIWKLNVQMINETDVGLSHYISQSASNARIDKALAMSDEAISVYSTNKKVKDVDSN